MNHPIDEMPPALDDASGGDVLRLHWKAPLPEPQYAAPRCCCKMTTTVIEGKEVVNAGCQVHGLVSYWTLRSPGSTVLYGFGK